MAGKTLVREGAAGDSLFIIKRGQADVYVANADGKPVNVAQRGAGEYFGEMSLTGAPRSASVVAALDTDVIVVDKHAFTTVLTIPASWKRCSMRWTNGVASSQAVCVEEERESGAKPSAGAGNAVATMGGFWGSRWHRREVKG